LSYTVSHQAHKEHKGHKEVHTTSWQAAIVGSRAILFAFLCVFARFARNQVIASDKQVSRKDAKTAKIAKSGQSACKASNFINRLLHDSLSAWFKALRESARAYSLRSSAV
jgi:hypothetical protein